MSVNPAFSAIAAPIVPITPVLLLSTFECDRQFMQDLLSGGPYALACAANWPRAENLVDHVVFPIILYERRFDGAGWQSAVRRLANFWGRSSVLLLSETSNLDLREELIGNGGFEILVRPFEFDVLQMLALATAHFALPALRSQPLATARMDSSAPRQLQRASDPRFEALTLPFSRGAGI
jgi:DNA-binding NtrC family response regulator